jgi:hypothetical protein
MKKKKIPTHDPYTGELNPYYQDLTGEPNPLAPKEKHPSFVLREALKNMYVGKKFFYYPKGMEGVLSYIEAQDIIILHNIKTIPPDRIATQIVINVVSAKGNIYDINDIYFYDEEIRGYKTPEEFKNTRKPKK